MIVLTVSSEDSLPKQCQNWRVARKGQSRPRCRSDCMENIANPENGKYFDFFSFEDCVSCVMSREWVGCLLPREGEAAYTWKLEETLPPLSIGHRDSLLESEVTKYEWN